MSKTSQYSETIASTLYKCGCKNPQQIVAWKINSSCNKLDIFHSSIARLVYRSKVSLPNFSLVAVHQNPKLHKHLNRCGNSIWQNPTLFHYKDIQQNRERKNCLILISGIHVSGKRVNALSPTYPNKATIFILTVSGQHCR